MHKNFASHTPRQGSRRAPCGGCAPLLSAAALLACSAALGCAAGATPDESASLRDQAAALFPRINPSASADSAADCAGAWAVLLRVYPPDQAEQAQAALTFARTRASLDDIRLEQRRLGLSLLTGRFPAATDRRAHQTLQRLRAFEIDGQRPFAGAVLLPPPSSASRGSNPQWSLARLRETQGPAATLYTLQVAAYEADDPALACQAAEQAAAALRGDGDQAFYHHGSGRSIVTVGVFTPRDYDPLTGAMSDSLRQLRQRFAYNLVNGRTIRERMPDGSWVEQPSALVVVP